ncbi:hypothetical protein V8C86DRAFT_3135922, partial [Haematococcus lacustris]
MPAQCFSDSAAVCGGALAQPCCSPSAFHLLQSCGVHTPAGRCQHAPRPLAPCRVGQHRGQLLRHALGPSSLTACSLDSAARQGAPRLPDPNRVEVLDSAPSMCRGRRRSTRAHASSTAASILVAEVQGVAAPAHSMQLAEVGIGALSHSQPGLGAYHPSVADTASQQLLLESLLLAPPSSPGALPAPPSAPHPSLGLPQLSPAATLADCPPHPSLRAAQDLVTQPALAAMAAGSAPLLGTSELGRVHLSASALQQLQAALGDPPPTSQPPAPRPPPAPPPPRA